MSGNVCYATYNEAASAYFQTIAPSIQPNGSLISYQNQGGIWIRLVTDSAGVSSGTWATLPTFDTCDTLQGFNDGLILAAALSVAVILASVWGIVKRAV